MSGSTTTDSASVVQDREGWAWPGRQDGAGRIKARGLVVCRATVKGRSNTADQLRSALQMKISHLGILPASVRFVCCIRLFDRPAGDLHV